MLRGFLALSLGVPFAIGAGLVAGVAVGVLVIAAPFALAYDAVRACWR